MGLKDRLRKLEGGGKGSCQVCGWGTPDLKVVVTWYDGHEDEDPEDAREPEYCPACGRPDLVVIRWPEHMPGEEDELERRRHEERQRRLREQRF